MHGNPSDCDLNDSSANSGAALWLGLPGAREHFDPSALSVTDRSRLASHGARRRADFEASRALLAFAGVGETAQSLSHSAGHAALFVAPSGSRIGVDLELNKPRDVLRLARFAFNDRETAALAAAPDEARLRHFYTLWTLKESFAKALRLALVDAVRECVFWDDDGTWRGRIPTQAAWGAAVFQPRPHLFLAAAWVGRPGSPELKQWEWPPPRGGRWPVLARPHSAAIAPPVQP